MYVNKYDTYVDTTCSLSYSRGSVESYYFSYYSLYWAHHQPPTVGYPVFLSMDGYNIYLGNRLKVHQPISQTIAGFLPSVTVLNIKFVSVRGFSILSRNFTMNIVSYISCRAMILYFEAITKIKLMLLTFHFRLGGSPKDLPQNRLWPVDVSLASV